MPAISVIIPFYNINKDIINRCVSSVLNQTFSDYEIIIVNDGSDPEFEMNLREIEKTDHRIKLLHQNNHGVSSARNRGVRAAKGEYIVFVDGDDVLLPEFFSEAYGFCKENNVDFLIGGNASLQDKSWENRNLEDPIFFENIDLEKRNSLKKNLVGNVRRFGTFGGYIGKGPWTRFIRRDIALRVPFDENLRMGEDIDWNLRILDESCNVYLAYRIWYLYFMHPASATRQYNPDIVVEVEQGLSKLDGLLNLQNRSQRVGYCQHLIAELRKIFICYIGHQECTLKSSEIRKIKSRFYKNQPWIKLKDVKLFVELDIKTSVKLLLYNTHSFFSVLKIRKALGILK